MTVRDMAGEINEGKMRKLSTSFIKSIFFGGEFFLT